MGEESAIRGVLISCYVTKDFEDDGRQYVQGDTARLPQYKIPHYQHMGFISNGTPYMNKSEKQFRSK